MSLIENPQQLIHSLKTFEKLYNIVRIVDPLEKHTVQMAEDEPNQVKESICYDFWQNGTHCANCVSMRASNENDTFVKIEYNKDKIYMVMATPLVLSGRPYVMELLKDITETGIVPDLKGKTIDEIEQTIQHLNQAVITDELTQIYNRRFLNERLPVDLYTSSISHASITAIMIDIDNFKSINDTFGHSTGDIALRRVAEIIKSSIHRNSDWAARYGGDEFLVVLPGSKTKNGRNIAEQIRAQIESEEIEHNGDLIKITISSGVHSILPDDTITSMDFLNQVDKKLYLAKKTGKNITIH